MLYLDGGLPAWVTRWQKGLACEVQYSAQCTVHSAQRTVHSAQRTRAGHECMLQRSRPSWLRMLRGLNVWVPHEARGFLCVWVECIANTRHRSTYCGSEVSMMQTPFSSSLWPHPHSPRSPSHVHAVAAGWICRLSIRSAAATNTTPSTHPDYETYTEQRTVSQPQSQHAPRTG
jgi:hypothetical protein